MKTFYLESALDNIGVLLKEIDSIASSHQINRNKKIDLEIVLVELFTNIVRHGYKGEPGVVNFSVDAKENEILIEVKDSGVTFIPNTYFTSLDEEDCLNENGYGIPLILSILSEVKFRRENEENIFSAIFKV